MTDEANSSRDDLATPLANPVVAGLDKIVGWGIVHDIFDAEESRSIIVFIGEHAEAINTKAFGAFFGEMQRLLGHTLILAISRMYEREGKRYRLRSIPAAIKYLDAHAPELPVIDRTAIVRCLTKLGYKTPGGDSGCDPAMTRALASTLGARHKVLQRAAGHAVKTTRDKVIAHHELVDAQALPKATYAQLDELLEFAKDVATVVGHAYTSIVYRPDSGEYSLTSDAERSTRSLRRLLIRAGVLSD